MILLEEIPNFQKLRYCDTDTSDTSDTVFFEATELVGRSSKIFQTFPFVDFENPPVIPGKGAKKVPDSCPAGTF